MHLTIQWWFKKKTKTEGLPLEGSWVIGLRKITLKVNLLEVSTTMKLFQDKPSNNKFHLN
jgi:hypothetical protein